MNELDLEPLPLGRRATYRRILAVLKAQPNPFVVAGSLGLSVHVGLLVDGELEIYVRRPDFGPVVQAIATTGFKVDQEEGLARAHVTFSDHRVSVSAVLPEPLNGEIDEPWFEHSSRAQLLGLKVRVAPPEELLWIRIAAKGAASLGDPLIGALLLQCADRLDWPRVLQRLVGMESLLLAHIFLFWYRYPESARRVVPRGLASSLFERLERLEGEASTSTVPPGGAG